MTRKGVEQVLLCFEYDLVAQLCLGDHVNTATLLFGDHRHRGKVSSEITVELPGEWGLADLSGRDAANIILCSLEASGYTEFRDGVVEYLEKEYPLGDLTDSKAYVPLELLE